MEKHEIEEVLGYLNQNKKEKVVETWYFAKCNSHTARGLWKELCKRSLPDIRIRY